MRDRMEGDREGARRRRPSSSTTRRPRRSARSSPGPRTTTSRSSATATTSSPASNGEDQLQDRAALRAGRAARADAGRRLGELLGVARATARARARAAAAGAHQGECARHRASPRLPRLHRREALRRRRQGHRRASLRGPLHFDRLPRGSARSVPLLAAQGRARDRARGLPPVQPHVQEPALDPAGVPARRALPGGRGHAARDRARHPAPGRPAQDAGLRPPRPLRALLLVPHLHAARELQHRRAAEDPGDPASRHLGGTSVEFTVYLSEAVLARLHMLVRTSPKEAPNLDIHAIEVGSRPGHAALGGRPQERAHGSPGRRTRRRGDAHP